MRSSTLLLAGPIAASAQILTTITGRVQTATISSGTEVLYTTTWTYSNPATNYLTLTDSDGVVTGMPSGTVVPMGEQPEAVTSQPAVATIPAGLPTGVTYVPYNGTSGLTSFQVSVGSSTTVVIGASPTDASVATGGSEATATGSSGSGSSSGGSGSNSGSDSESGSGSDASTSESAASASASESGNAASSVRVAGAGVGLLAFIAALL